MTPTQVMAALRDHWDEVWALLDDPTRTALLGLVERLPEDPERVSRKISRLLLAAGPQAYVLFGASTSDSVRFIPGPHEAPGLLVALAVSLRELGGGRPPSSRRPGARRPPTPPPPGRPTSSSSRTTGCSPPGTSPPPSTGPAGTTPPIPT